ncbi:polysaccharide deacetylase family protein [Streptacidiphilus carbonis]|uniref:polysaccharide deacetylase family protein n=1 Tax=Streptacidiphilus carbonis TaxID=105422 RepID=UPI000694CA51|nr:polysaccharide deacetylase family protein [Streptacidiphilus carbonis]
MLTFRGLDDPGAFRAQVERLLRVASPVALTQVQDALTGGTPLPPRPVLLTFEHGHRSAATTALPVLAAHRVPAVAFVVAGLVGSERPYWWDEARFLIGEGGYSRRLPGRSAADAVAAMAALPDPDRRGCLEELRVTARRSAPGQAQLTAEDLRALRDGGVAIGNHSLGHARLDRCDDYVVREEVVGGHTLLTELTGEEPSAFAHPHGVADGRAEALLRGYGYRSAFLGDDQLFDLRSAGAVRPDPLRISRLGVDLGTSRGIFDSVLAGWAPGLRRLRGAVAV